jgi:hypothetical protein
MVPVSQLVVFIIQLLHLEQLDGQVVSCSHKTISKIKSHNKKNVTIFQYFH